MTKKQNNLNVYVVGGDKGYACWIDCNIVKKMEDSDLVLFTGGEDVSPFLYDRKVHPTTGVNYPRDMEEVQAFQEAHYLGLHMLGICRGAQLLCALSGGILVQNQANPEFIHEMSTFDRQRIPVSSTHHQAQYPWGMNKDEFKLLGWTRGVSPYHEGESKEQEMVNGIVENDMEAEVVYYPKYRALGIQSHPEMLYHKMDYNHRISESMEWMGTILSMHMLDKL